MLVNTRTHTNTISLLEVRKEVKGPAHDVRVNDGFVCMGLVADVEVVKLYHRIQPVSQTNHDLCSHGVTKIYIKLKSTST